LYQVVEKGTGPRPEVSAGVRIRYKYQPIESLDVDAVGKMDLDHMPWQCDSDTFAKAGQDKSSPDFQGGDGRNPEFRVGEGDVIGAWDLMVSLMNEGEKAYVIATAAYCWRLPGLPPHIRPNQDMLFFIDLQTITHGPLDMNAMDAAQRTHIAEQKKARGNFLYKRGDYDGAIRTYIQALRIVSHGTVHSPDADRDDDEVVVASANRSKQMIALHLAVLNNLSQAHLVTRSIDKARKICDEALEIDENNIKALYRSGCVYLEMKAYSESARDFSRLLTLDSGNTDAKNKLKLVNKRIQKEKVAERALYTAMMGKNDTAVKRRNAPKKDDQAATVHTRIAPGTDTSDTEHAPKSNGQEPDTNGDAADHSACMPGDVGMPGDIGMQGVGGQASAEGVPQEGRRTPPKSSSPLTLVSSLNEKTKHRKETRNVTFHETVSDNPAAGKDVPMNTRQRKSKRNRPVETDSTLDWFMVLYSVVVVIFMVLVIYNVYHMDKMHSSKLLDKYR
ncbi:hypothetical protein SARC_11497, partial [Sphaeroforma arctica JP610]